MLDAISKINGELLQCPWTSSFPVKTSPIPSLNTFGPLHKVAYEGFKFLYRSSIPIMCQITDDGQCLPLTLLDLIIHWQITHWILIDDKVLIQLLHTCWVAKMHKISSSQFPCDSHQQTDIPMEVWDQSFRWWRQQ